MISGSVWAIHLPGLCIYKAASASGSSDACCYCCAQVTWHTLDKYTRTRTLIMQKNPPTYMSMHAYRGKRKVNICAYAQSAHPVWSYCTSTCTYLLLSSRGGDTNGSVLPSTSGRSGHSSAWPRCGTDTLCNRVCGSGRGGSKNTSIHTHTCTRAQVWRRRDEASGSGTKCVHGDMRTNIVVKLVVALLMITTEWH